MTPPVLVALGGLVLLQATWLPSVRIAGVMPDVVLVAITTWSLLVGGLVAAPLAVVAGLLLDLVSGGPFGLSAVALLLAVLATGWWRGTLYYGGIGVFVLAAVVGTVAYDAALLIGMQTFHDPVRWPGALRAIVAPSAVLNAALAVPTAYVLGAAATRLGFLESSR